MNWIAVAAIGTMLSAVTTMLVFIRTVLVELRKNTAIAIDAAKVGQESHVMINSQRDAAIAQQTRTDDALRAAGIEIPYNPAVEEQVTGTESGHAV